MKAIWHLALKDLLLIWRDKSGLFWIIGFPLIMALLFGAIFSGEGGGPGTFGVGIVNEDQGPNAQLFIEELRKSEALRIRELSRDSAQYLVRQGKLTAYVLLKPGFGKVENMFGSDEAFIEIGLDPARKVAEGLLQGLIAQTSFKLMQSQMADKNNMLASIRSNVDQINVDTAGSAEERNKLVNFLSGLESFVSNYDTSIFAGSGGGMQGPKVEKVSVFSDQINPKSSYEITFPSAILWALIGCTSAFAVSIVVEKRRGTLLRLRIAPLSRAHILAGKGLACFMTIITVSAVLLLFGRLVFGVRLDQPMLLAVALLSGAFCFTGMMMLISVLGKTEQAVGGAGMAILLIMAMTGGGMIPLFVMPSWMITVSNFSPVKWGIIGLEGAIWRGFTMFEMMTPVSVLLGIGIAAFLAATFIMTRSEI